MTAKGHFIFSLASIILAKKLAITIAIVHSNWWHLLFGSFFACLLPDIDHQKSLLGKKLTYISIPISKIFGHRGFTHSLFIIIVIKILFTLHIIPKNTIPIDIFQAMIIGYLSHIIADMLTPNGVPLLWPYSWRFSIPIILNNKKKKYTERLICILILILALNCPEKKISIINNLHYLENIKIFWQKYIKSI